MKYVPPGGKTAAFISKLFRRDAESELAEDLKRLKALLETELLPEEENDGMSPWRHRTVRFTRNAGDAVDRCVHENPWLTAACVAIVCFSLGTLLGRRREVPLARRKRFWRY
jgi:ElaB/YqjD/DUF883 family membrane-anchored ribosome-binding protein